MIRILKYSLFGILLTVAVLNAQNQDDALRDKIDRLSQRVQRIQELARKYDDGRALELIRKAVANFQEAKVLYGQHKFKAALVAFKIALSFTELAEKRLLTKPALRSQQKLDEMLHRAELAVLGADNDEARYFLNRARSFSREANQAYRSRRYIKGQEFQRIALYFAQKAIDVVQSRQSDNSDQAKLRQQLTNIQNLLQEVLKSDFNSTGAGPIIGKARVFLKEARASYEAGNFKQARSKLLISERLLYRAIDLKQTGNSVSRKEIEENLQSLRRFLADVEQAISGSGPDEATGRRLLVKARRFFRAAQKDYENASFRPAYNKILLAQRLATRALRSGQEDQVPDNNRLAARINEIRQLLSLQDEKIAGQNQPYLADLHGVAISMLNDAQSSLQNNEPLRAFRMLHLTIRLVNRIDGLLSQARPAAQDPDELSGQLKKLESLINTIDARTRQSEKLQSMVGILRNLLQKARTNLTKGKYEVSSQLLEFIRVQTNQLLKDAV